LKDAVSPAEAVRAIGSGMKVFIHGAAATPTPLIDALAARADLENLTTYHLHLEGRVAIAEPGQEARLRPTSLFTGASLRQAVNEGRADFVPVFSRTFLCSSAPGAFRWTPRCCSSRRPTSMGTARSARPPTPPSRRRARRRF
jgi:4-hydroxybutyrate CoA-transferase